MEVWPVEWQLFIPHSTSLLGFNVWTSKLTMLGRTNLIRAGVRLAPRSCIRASRWGLGRGLHRTGHWL